MWRDRKVCSGGGGGHGNTWVEKTFEKYNDIDNKVYDEAKQFIKEVFDIK